MSRQTDRQKAAEWARQILQNEAVLILDTETTGLGYRDQIVEIAVINTSGQTLMNQLIKPTISIPPGASRIHGITDADVAAAPTFADIHQELSDLVQNRHIVIYNADYDVRMVRQSARAAGLEPGSGPDIRADCAMLWYAQWFGDWNEYHGDYRWQKLRGGNHRALGDCLATLERIREMAHAD